MEKNIVIYLESPCTCIIREPYFYGGRIAEQHYSSAGLSSGYSKTLGDGIYEGFLPFVVRS